MRTRFVTQSCLLIHFILCVSFSFFQSALAQSAVPSPTPCPDQIKRPGPVSPLGCDRPFLFRGELYPTDSPQAQDAAILREMMLDVPEAATLLNEYSSNRKKTELSAYTGTLGVLLLILANPISRGFDESTRESVRSTMRIGGLALAAGGFFYSFTLLSTNESLITNAVKRYNEKRPDDPIELKFEAGWKF